jgi:hypothetical protein
MHVGRMRKINKISVVTPKGMKPFRDTVVDARKITFLSR